MTPRTDPVTEPIPGANGHPAEPVIDNDLDDGPREPGVEIFLDLDPASRAFIADWKWLNEQYVAGAWADYAGEYIAVYRERLVGHDPDLDRLRGQVTRDHGIPADQVVTAFVEPDILS